MTTTEQSAASPDHGGKRFLRNCVYGLGLVFFAPLRTLRFRASVDQAAVFVLFGIATSVLTYYLEARLEGGSWREVAEHVGLRTLIGLAAYYAVVRFNRRAAGLADLIVATGIMVVLFEPLFHLEIYLRLQLADPVMAQRLGDILNLILTVWFIVTLIRALQLVFNLTGGRAAIQAGSLMAIVVAFYVTHNFKDLSYWYETEIVPTREQKEAAKRKIDPRRINIERSYYAQGPLLRQALGGIKASRPEIIELYHLGFAADATGPVFLSEARSVRQLLARRFDTAGRSVLLANSRQTVRTAPLANGSNLARTIGQMAKKMDREKDLLLLTFAAGGATRGTLWVRFPRFNMNDLDVLDLKRMLDRAGVKWRVIVFSACFSGSMLAPLKDPNTLIITAARAGRKSFGCPYDGKMTPFGARYYGAALEQTHSFIAAFEETKAAIIAEETADELTPSEPQIHIGSAIRLKLLELEARLNRRGGD